VVIIVVMLEIGKVEVRRRRGRGRGEHNELIRVKRANATLEVLKNCPARRFIIIAC